MLYPRSVVRRGSRLQSQSREFPVLRCHPHLSGPCLGFSEGRGPVLVVMRALAMCSACGCGRGLCGLADGGLWGHVHGSTANCG